MKISKEGDSGATKKGKISAETDREGGMGAIAAHHEKTPKPEKCDYQGVDYYGDSLHQQGGDHGD